MQMGVSTRPARRWSLLALVALLGLSLTFATGSVSSGASSGHAVAAKKCKKKGKKSATAAKKKKCKKKQAPIAPPALTPPKGPIERIVITWTGNADLDVHAWSNGLHDGWNETLGGGQGDFEVQIPGTTYEESGSTGNSERIVETSPNPSVPMTFGICNYPEGALSNADVNVKWVLADGTTQTDAFTLNYANFIVEEDAQAGPADPDEEWCPLP